MFGQNRCWCPEGVRRVSGGCLEGVWRVSGRCLKHVRKVSGRPTLDLYGPGRYLVVSECCLDRVWRVSGSASKVSYCWVSKGCLEGVLKVSETCLEGVC